MQHESTCDIVHIIDVHTYSAKMHMYVKFEASNIYSPGEGYQVKNIWDIVNIINMDICSTQMHNSIKVVTQIFSEVIDITGKEQI